MRERACTEGRSRLCGCCLPRKSHMLPTLNRTAHRVRLVMTLAGVLCLGSAHAAASANQPESRTGDAARGQTLYTQQCMACHAADISLAGPLHRGVVGRPSASVPDYPYSPALQRLKLTWNERTLDTWLRDPNRMAPGNRMGFAVPSAHDRQDLIAYLKTLQPQAATGRSKP